MHLFIYLFIYLYIYLFIYLCIYLFIYFTYYQEIERVSLPYSFLGFPGMIGSMDVVKFEWQFCPAEFSPHFKGKEGVCTVGYEMVLTINLNFCTSSHGHMVI